jgi:lipoate---protein ligase
MVLAAEQSRFAGVCSGHAMHLLDLTLPTAAENLALDESLLLQAEDGTGGEVLRLWEYPDPVVVLGAGCRLREDVDEAACAADRVPILRRSSGGGTVLWSRGCLLFSLVLSYDRSLELAQITSSYRYILGRLAATLAAAGIAAEPAGTSDLTLAGRKFSGNAQQRKRRFLLHHGTLLYAFDLASVGRYLLPPPRQPEYRGGRDHAKFLCNLPLNLDYLKRGLRGLWRAEVGINDWSPARIERLVREKYAAEHWIRRR